MEELRERFDREILELGVGIPEIRDKVVHTQGEYDWLRAHIKDVKVRYLKEKEDVICKRDQLLHEK